MRTILLHLLLLAIPMLGMSQSTPTSVNRGAANLTQVDQYLTAAKRLGIPTSPTDNLAATETPQNSAKLLYNTTLNKLRVYNPVTETWRDAIEADLTNYYTKTEIDALLNGKISTSEKGQNNGVAPLDANGKIPPQYVDIPDVPVTSVNGKTGDVVLTKADVGLGNVDNTSDLAKPISTATQTALDGKANTSHTHNASDINAGTLNIARIPTGTTGSTVALGNDTRINNGQTAFGWGNHASAGYLKYVGGIPTGADLNDYTSTGVYGINSTTAGSVLNKPLDLGQTATLEVLYSGTYVIQKYFVSSGANANYTWFRTRNSGGWNNWVLQYSDNIFTVDDIAKWNSAYPRLSDNNTGVPAVQDNSTMNDKLYGFGYSAGAEGQPAAGAYLSAVHSNGYGYQLHGRSENLRVRFSENSVWSDWRNIWHSGNLRSNAQNDARYLQLTGGTVTGVIKSPAPVADADLANKEYVDSQSVIEALNEGKGIGYRIRGRNPNNYGDIGSGAVDLSLSQNSSTDNGATGSLSFAAGTNTIAAGSGSFAVGQLSSATGVSSAAFGYNTTASGSYSAAFGGASVASGQSSFASGYLATASGNYAIALGRGATASGDYSIAMGYNTKAENFASAAIGWATKSTADYAASFNESSTASGRASSSFGYGTNASGTYSTAFGYQSKAQSPASVAMGEGVEANTYASLVIGRYPTIDPVEAAYDIGSPIFKVGGGFNNNLRFDSYVLYNDGRSEQVKDMEVTEIGQGFVLKSPDGTRWRITVDNSGNLTTTSL